MSLKQSPRTLALFQKTIYKYVSIGTIMRTISLIVQEKYFTHI